MYGAGWLAGHRGIEAYSHGHVHRPVCVQCTSHYYGPWMSCLLAGIASAAATPVCTSLHAAPRRRGPAQPARHDSTQNSSLHARTPKARQARTPSSLERRPSAGLTAAQVVVCDNPLKPANSCDPRAVILTATRPVSSLARTSRSGMVMQPPQMSGIGSGVSSSFRARLAQTAHGDMPSVTHSLPPAPAVTCRQHKISC